MAQSHSGSFTWRIDRFSMIESGTRLYSDVFSVGRCNWRIRAVIRDDDKLSMYLRVEDTKGLLWGWRISTQCSLAVVKTDNSIEREVTQHVFTPEEKSCGWEAFKRLSHLLDVNQGYLDENTLVVKAEVEVLDRTDHIDRFFTNPDNFITVGQGSALGLNLTNEAPSSEEEVERANESLRDCLKDLCKSNMRERLAAALETLVRANSGLSDEQRDAITVFCSRFEVFVLDFLTYERDNSHFELLRMTRDMLACSLKENQKTYLCNKQIIEDLYKEEAERWKRLAEAKSERAKLLSDTETLMRNLVDEKVEFETRQKELKDAEEKKRIAEDDISKSNSALSMLKTHFL